MAGKYAYAGMIIVVVLLIPAFIPLTGAQSEGSVTRSQAFTVTITGLPNTAYYVWLSGTFSLSGEPGDQPPVIASNQLNIVQDPPEGPYVIGSYHYYDGNGRTILDDVAPSSSTVSNTSYYAQVTTDSSGIGIVTFLTSHDTAAQSFSVIAQNPASPGQVVNVALGVPTQVPTSISTLLPSTILPTALPTTMTMTSIPAFNTTLMTPVLTPASEPVKTPPTGTPLSAGLVIAAAGTAFLVWGRNRR